MDKILHDNLGETSVSPMKKGTEPCKYEIFDPNVSDDESSEDK